MKWDIEERTEDAVVAYLKTKCGDMRVSAAWERDEMQYPAAVVHAAQSVPISDLAAWHDPRNIAVDVAVITEAAPELDTNGVIVKTARERNAAARSVVMDALFTSSLLAELQAAGIESVAFSMAQFATATRTNEGRYLVTTISGLVIAEPVSGS